MVETYIAQVEVLGLNYADIEKGIKANGKVVVDFTGQQYISHWTAYPKTKTVVLGIEINHEKLGIPKSINLKTMLRQVILGQIGKINLPFTRRVPLV